MFVEWGHTYLWIRRQSNDYLAYFSSLEYFSVKMCPRLDKSIVYFFPGEMFHGSEKRGQELDFSEPPSLTGFVVKPG